MSLDFNYDSDDKNKLLLRQVIITSSYCETLGFNNGKWEFNFDVIMKDINDFIFINYTIYDQYRTLGGKNINIKKWNASDDTILLLSTIKGIIDKNYRLGLIKYIEPLKNDKRISGVTTIKSIVWINNNPTKELPYTNNAGGNGAAIRTAPIGILFTDIQQIIIHSFANSILTHNQVLGFLGGISSAIITFFAKNNVKPENWFKELIKLEPLIDKIINISNYDFKDQYNQQKFTFWDKIKDYNEFRLPKILNKNIYQKTYTRYQSLLRIVRPNYKKSKNHNLGGSGLEAIILSYEFFILSIIPNTHDIDFDNLIYHGVLHFGDNDSTGAIVGAWYAAYHKNIPDFIKTEQLEFIKDIDKIINKL